MRLTRHGSHLVQLTHLGLINAYLVSEANGLTLIDTGMPGGGPALLGAARTLGQSIRRIVLTHAHGDHIGGLDALHAALPEVPVFISPRDARLLRGDHTLDPGEPQTPLRGDLRQSAVPVIPLADGEQIGSLRAVATPGHTPGHLAFLDTRDGTLIAGDAFQTVMGTAVSSERRWTFPFPALATWHAPTALASARRLSDLRPTRLAAGHGRVTEAPVEAMLRAVERAERRSAAAAQPRAG
ncbi:MBL fold metallo-hydrolase [Deinococcus hopiensis]|uniref:Glyoxylase, beta-lactamase superfamily II n=1 Tax=Deinococcus hopiensis KR-140 TaxID=695939 RepID=A0A1W1VN70_9DEIO|nr:MBL fold metallo-hydrolase [Deinococcus hopiensis]SMB94776.1 Glyoxylase, beta-lactamase superfamily II [Deinococcus hopiensis KR-140]